MDITEGFGCGGIGAMENGSSGVSAADPSVEVRKRLQWVWCVRFGIDSLSRASVILRKRPFCQANLQARIADGRLPPGEIIGDVTDISVASMGGLRGKLNMFTGGLLCQDISLAGLQAGLQGGRSWLFFGMISHQP